MSLPSNTSQQYLGIPPDRSFPFVPPYIPPTRKRPCGVGATQLGPKRSKLDPYHASQAEIPAMCGGPGTGRLETRIESIEARIWTIESILGLNSDSKESGDSSNNVQKIQQAIQDTRSMLTVMCEQLRSLTELPEDHNRVESAAPQASPTAEFDFFLDPNRLELENPLPFIQP